MTINNTLMLSVIGTNVGQQHIHTLHFRENTVGDQPAVLIEEWKAGCLLAYRRCFHVSQFPAQLIKTVYVCGTTPLPAGAEDVPIPADQEGFLSNVGDPMPSFISSLTIERGTLAGRSRSGRYFIGGAYELDVAGQVFNTDYFGYLNDYADALKATFVDAVAPNFRLVTHSRKLAAVPGTACNVSSTPVGNLVVSGYVTTMRSRKLGHGI